MSNKADEFLANLVIELVPLSTSASLAMSDGEFLANRVLVVLSNKMSTLALEKR